MKRIFSIALLVGVFVFGTQAQDKKQQHHGRHKVESEKSTHVHKAHKSDREDKSVMKKTKDDLDLSASQQEQMRSVNQEYRNQVKVLKEDRSLSQQEKKQQLKALQTKRRDAVKAILTPEQQQKIVNHKKSRKKQHNRKDSIK